MVGTPERNVYCPGGQARAKDRMRNERPRPRRVGDRAGIDARPSPYPILKNRQGAACMRSKPVSVMRTISPSCTPAF